MRPFLHVHVQRSNAFALSSVAILVTSRFRSLCFRRLSKLEFFSYEAYLFPADRSWKFIG